METQDRIEVTGGYLVEEVREGKYIVFAGFVEHDNGEVEYVGTHNGRHGMTYAVLDTYRKGPLASK